jgi:hypothetical protein
VLAGLDRTERPPGRTPLLHSPPAALFWCATGLALAFALAPDQLAGAALALASGLGSGLALDALGDGEMFLWPAGGTPSEWLAPYRPGALVELEGRLFVAPSPDGVVPRPWNNWRVLEFRRERTGRGLTSPAIGRLRRHTDLLLSAASLAALLLAVVLK